MAIPRKQVEPTSEQVENLLRNLLNSSYFSKRHRTIRPLLQLFFKNAAKGGVSTQEVLKLPEFKGRRKEEFPDASFPRVEIVRLRKALKAYFAKAIYDDEIACDVLEAEKGFYPLVFFVNEVAHDGEELTPFSHFWLPFLAHDTPIRFITPAETPFWDAQPKGYKKRQHKVLGEIPPLPAIGTLNPVYLPMGLLEAYFTASRFFSERHQHCEFDAPLNPPLPDGSVFIIGGSPFEGVKPKHLTLPTCFPEVRPDLELLAGTYGDHYRGNGESTLFRCYARLHRIPVSAEKGFAALQIKAFHSIAVEAAMKFLTSPPDTERLLERLRGPGERIMPMDYDFDVRKSILAASLEELAVLFRVTCSVTDAKALTLRPNIPCSYLKIQKTEIVEVLQPEGESIGVYNPTTSRLHG